MEEYGKMEYLELAVTRCGRWTGNREFMGIGKTGRGAGAEFIWSGLSLFGIYLEWPKFV